MIFKPKKTAELIIIFILSVIVAGIEIADLELFMEKMKEWGIKLEESSFYKRRKKRK
ncbi:MAG: hypothetical protein K2O96_05260 [Lachnospiraceae bacterium]|nr:hypothetical protein [Lachnospiraceae bacterium]